MDSLSGLVDLFLHLDKHLVEVVNQYGVWTYTILFLIIFCETGLVITPFLPGDSLLFAAGAIAGRGELGALNLAILLTIAAVIGDAVNYHIGKFLGPKAFQDRYSKIFKREYLERTQKFYEKYGGKAIVIARFVPIVRTFAPFLAGVGKMNYSYFVIYNIGGAVLWVFSLVFAGYFFSEMPVVKNNFSLVILAIIVLSVLPAVYELIQARRESQRAA